MESYEVREQNHTVKVRNGAFANLGAMIEARKAEIATSQAAERERQRGRDDSATIDRINEIWSR